ncbi:unnamed protein product [Paramecium sonneborni]|uniref:Nas2 N-terminal domain-containing protein n=1 Tax=Paramecium sonneborni TaxID=65129 RepID=A0A8S1K8G1_9CILI|nr:unnamed protein product [Paramecium sonneborni]
MQKQKLFILQKQRKELEEHIEQLNQQLQVYYDKGYNKSLIDDEGFPRQDLDFGELSTYKNLRREFNEKNNDYKDLMKLLEQTIVGYHQELQNDPNLNNEIEEYTQKWREQQQKQQQQLQQQQQQQQQQKQQSNNQLNNNNNEYCKQNENDLIKPFAYLEDVIKESPADKAGFKINDFLIRFGIIDHSNHNRLQNLYDYIKNQQNKQINVKIVRLLVPSINIKNIDFSTESYIIMDMTITPQAWNGKGLLGWKMNMI